jgi:hypothetical protein
MKPLLIVLTTLLLALVPATAIAASEQEAMMQDDNHFLYTTPAKQRKALREAKALGVDRIRVTLLWTAMVPNADKRKKPKGFDGADPTSYDPGVWTKYDDLLEEAHALGLGVNFNVTGPSPLWANEKPPRPDIADNYEPSPKQFGNFVETLGKRYSGHYSDSLTGSPERVDYWSIWNEPNHSGWLTPTWEKRKGKFVERSASLYRSLLNSAWRALQSTGHKHDTILYGETAPAGNDSMDVKRFMKPYTFLKALYCVDDKLKRLKGKDAKRLACPAGKQAFVNANPALFKASGYAHHPYQLLTAPDVAPEDEGIITIAVLDRLEKSLDKIQHRYGRSRRIPIYLTEFGYQTPPDPVGVSLKKQATFINEAEYIAAKDKRVRSMSQFLLFDDGDPVGLTFQSGLKTLKGKEKPAYAAYQLPIWVTGKSVKRKVWGLVRPARANTRVKALVQFRPKGGKWDTIKTVKTKGRSNTFNAKVKLRKAGKLRVKSGAYESRAAAIKVEK